MWHSKGANSMKKQSIFRPIPVLTKRMFRTNRGRNLVAILAILLTTMMFATLFTLTQSMRRNLVEMTFRQTRYDAQASFRDITEEQAALQHMSQSVRLIIYPFLRICRNWCHNQHLFSFRRQLQGGLLVDLFNKHCSSSLLLSLFQFLNHSRPI